MHIRLVAFCLAGSQSTRGTDQEIAQFAFVYGSNCYIFCRRIQPVVYSQLQTADWLLFAMYREEEMCCAGKITAIPMYMYTGNLHTAACLLIRVQAKIAWQVRRRKSFCTSPVTAADINLLDETTRKHASEVALPTETCRKPDKAPLLAVAVLLYADTAACKTVLMVTYPDVLLQTFLTRAVLHRSYS